MTLNGVMAATLRYFTEFGKHAFQHITARQEVSDVTIEDLKIGHDTISWCDRLKYLGVLFKIWSYSVSG